MRLRYYTREKTVIVRILECSVPLQSWAQQEGITRAIRGFATRIFGGKSLLLSFRRKHHF